LALRRIRDRWAGDDPDVLADRDRIARDLHEHVIGRLFQIGMALHGNRAPRNHLRRPGQRHPEPGPQRYTPSGNGRSPAATPPITTGHYASRADAMIKHQVQDPRPACGTAGRWTAGDRIGGPVSSRAAAATPAAAFQGCVVTPGHISSRSVRWPPRHLRRPAKATPSRGASGPATPDRSARYR